jgi:flavin-binding protein dodecin
MFAFSFFPKRDGPDLWDEYPGHCPDKRQAHMPPFRRSWGSRLYVWQLLSWVISRMEGKPRSTEVITMSVARVTELSATSETSFDDAINEAVTRATKTLRGVEGAWVKDQNVLIEDGNITGYKVNVEVTFVLEE